MKVLVYHPRLTPAYVELLQGRGLSLLPCHNAAAVWEQAAAAEVVFGWRLPPGSLAEARRLCFIQLMGAGADDLLADPAWDRSVPVACARGAFGYWMAEYVLGLLLAVEKDVPRLLRQQAVRRWEPYRVGRLHGKTLGLAGLGSSRRLTGAAAALGMTVRGYRRTPEPVEGVEHVWGPGELPAFLTGLDYLVLALPLTGATRGLIGRDELGRLKPSSWLVNVGRGAVVREPELIEALRDGVIRGAVLDVFTHEPLPPGSPLWSMDNVVITPHLAAPSLPEDMVGLLLDNLDNYQAGRPLAGRVDPERGY